MPSPEPFQVHVADEVLTDLRNRLLHTRYAPDFGNEDWRYGTERTYLETFVEYWINHYDWRLHEASINSFNNFRIILDDVPIHFVHELGHGPAPIPLILTHGWPWTFWDYHEMIGPLTDPARYGGDPRDAFELVVPSLPGFAFSSPLLRTGVGSAVTSELWARLMTDVLGHERFVAGGSDYGAIVAIELAHDRPDLVMGIHVTAPAFSRVLRGAFERPEPEAYAPDEAGWYEQTKKQQPHAVSHHAINRNDPQSFAYALNDSPAGLAAWLLERRRTYGDTGGDVEHSFSKDDLITSFMLFWVTETFGSSMRFYWEDSRHPWTASHTSSPGVTVPTGMAVFPKDAVLIPRTMVEQDANLVHWTVMPSGGHYAPSEQPELLVKDIREYARRFR